MSRAPEGDDAAREREIDFDRLVTPAALEPGRFSIAVPDGWQQGRGAFGGLVIAYLARAAEATAAAPDRVLRSLSAQLVGPLQPGPAEIAVDILRAGSSLTALTARLMQAGEVQAHAAVTLARARPTYAAPPSLSAPDLPPWRDGALTPLPRMAAPAPVFTRHLEFWPTGPLPFTGADPAAALATSGWVRLRRPGRARDAAFIVAHVDSYWPGFLAADRVPRQAVTLTFSLETLSSMEGLDPDAPLYYRARMLGGQDGYAVEARELWGEDRRLIALNQQVFAVLS